eukprot:gene1197-biopygen4756
MPRMLQLVAEAHLRVVVPPPRGQQRVLQPRALALLLRGAAGTVWRRDGAASPAGGREGGTPRNQRNRFPLAANRGEFI